MAARKTRPGGSKPDKIWRDALMLAANEPGPTGRKRLREAAEKVVELALAGDMAAIKEMGDRLDGRPAMSATGDDDGPPKLVIQLVDPMAR